MTRPAAGDRAACRSHPGSETCPKPPRPGPSQSPAPGPPRAPPQAGLPATRSHAEAEAQDGAERMWGLLWAPASPPTHSDSPSSRRVTGREARPSGCALGSGQEESPLASPHALRSAAVRVEKTGGPFGPGRAFLLSRTGVRRCPSHGLLELLELLMTTAASTPGSCSRGHHSRDFLRGLVETLFLTS